ncbi:MAG: hypothetical protein E7652_00390 [Ruminococcaceae bacterium]|nr:hypothetical protein [Oscillospiraceae bacterium]
MKRILVILLCLTICIFVLAACSKTSTDNSSIKNEEKAENNTNASDSEKVSDKKETENIVEDIEEKEPDQIIDYGTYTESEFKNEWVDLIYVPRSDLISSPEDDRLLNEATDDDSRKTLMDYYSEYEKGKDKIAVYVQKVETGTTADVLLAELVADDIEYYIRNDVTYTEYDKGTYELCGKSYEFQTTDTISPYGYTLHSKVMLRIANGYAILIIAQGEDETATEALLNEFVSYKSFYDRFPGELKAGMSYDEISSVVMSLSDIENNENMGLMATGTMSNYDLCGFYMTSGILSIPTPMVSFLFNEEGQMYQYNIYFSKVRSYDVYEDVKVYYNEAFGFEVEETIESDFKSSTWSDEKYEVILMSNESQGEYFMNLTVTSKEYK